MKVIETEAIAPQPLRIEGDRSNTEEVWIFDEAGNFIGTEWRMTPAAQEELDNKPIEEPDIVS